MKIAKFEIINSTWIKQLVLEGINEKLKALKISAITTISSNCGIDNNGEETHYMIFFNDTGNSNLRFYYSKSEKEQYENDLVFFEELLYRK